MYILYTTYQYELFVSIYLSQMDFRTWLDGQTVIDGKGISRIGDSEFSMNITVGLLIQMFTITFKPSNVIDIITTNITVQNDLKHFYALVRFV